MKKQIRVFKAALLLGVAVGLCGCGQTGDAGKSGADAGVQDEVQEPDNEGSEGENEEAANAGEEGQDQTKGFVFDAGGVTLGVDVDMDELKTQLEESKSIFEAPSCAGEGISYIYNYISYEVETYPAQDGRNLIARITLKDDTVATNEGIDLSMTRDDVIRVYGENYEESTNQFIYEKNGSKLYFIFDGDNIISIEYISAVLG